MPVSSSDIVFYASDNMPQDDVSVAGGDINSGLRVVFTDIVATDIVEAVSTNTGDVQFVSVFGRNVSGIAQTDTFALSGTTLVSGSLPFERILKITIDSLALGTITFRDAAGDTGIASIPIGETGIIRPFINATADAFGGSDKVFYNKVFLKNNNVVSVLQSATITESVTGIYNITQFGLEKTSQYTESVATRLTAPTGVTSYGSGVSGLPGTNLDPLEYQGVWLQLTANDGEAATNSFYQMLVQGVTT